MEDTSFIHNSAVVEKNVHLGKSVKIWNNCHVRAGATLGDSVSIGKDSYVDVNVQIGKGSRVQNQVNIYNGVMISDWCFIGPAVVFTNDQFPRVGNKTWKITPTFVETGASIGAGAVIRCGITLGAFCMIGAGAIVTRSVQPFSLVIGNPACEAKKICACGQTILPLDSTPSSFIRDCCPINMSEETLSAAKKEISKLTEL